MTDELSKSGESLVKQELITREDLSRAQAHEAKTGMPWYKQLLQKRKLNFASVEEVLRYEFHSKSVRNQQKALGDALVEAGELSQTDLQHALKLQKHNGRLLGNILIENKYVSKNAIGRVLANQYGLEFIDIDTIVSQPEALKTVPESMAKRNQFLPVALDQDKLTVLITSPQIGERLESTGILLQKRIHAVLTASTDFVGEIEARYAHLHAMEPDEVAVDDMAPTAPIKKYLLETSAEVEEESFTHKDVDPMEETTLAVDEKHDRFEDIARMASGTSVVNMVNTVIEGAVNSGATDIHLDPQDPEMRVRYRIDGILHDIMSIPKTMQLAVVSRVKIIADLDITETRHPQDGHIGLEISDREFDVRVATLPTFLGERVVLRLLDQSTILSGIKYLGLEKEDEKKLNHIIDQPYGMILVTGPTGSGKTTTLYAALNQKNVMTDSIVTLEDPVEYQLSGINQVQIDPEIGVTFAHTLRAALRQDIDVLLVGEIRDKETARIAVRASMTGHLVFSTLHTNDAPEAIGTLRNMGVPSYLICSALTAVIGQRLVRTICPECKASFKPTATLLKSIGLPTTVKSLYRGKGCDHCYNTGNFGRTGIFEVLEITPAIRSMISDELSTEEITKNSKLKTMAMRCRQKVRSGDVNPEEFLRVIRT